ncbi:hypothetical protein E4Z66_18415 [Aliishimia ponticola]|uniref:Calcium-binding protein n=1 Tax=Aliishimia ponticola TaxID=2499833 RepID=A0A4S4N8T9_9RHOB|nr:hypothetical protein [Aliishimia ponticola]THH34411.1 hypothetical protein E4Z66_18415 [Aliishimia ponticola]
MTTAYVQVAQFARGDTLRLIGTDTISIFSEDGTFDFQYLFPSDEFDPRVELREPEGDIVDFGSSVTFTEITVFNLEFGSSSADYMVIVDVDAGYEYFFQLSSDGANVPDFPTSLDDYDAIVNDFTGFNKMTDSSTGVFSVSLASLFEATLTEDDNLNFLKIDSDEDLSLGEGNDTVYSGAGRDQIQGGDGDDRLVATSTEEGDWATFYGNKGDDFLKAKNLTRAEFYGNTGDDTLYGASQDDWLDGGQNNDVLYGLAGNDEMYGGSGNDIAYGGSGNDYIEGGDGADLLRGNRDSDTLLGGAGADDLRGGGGGDDLQGGDGDDYVLGEGGSDTLTGGLGDDTLVGGFGSGNLDGARDTFVFEAGGGFDRVKDFEVGIDRIDLSDFGFTDFDTDVLPLTSEKSSGLRIDFGDGTVAFLEGITLAELASGDVILL